MREAAADAMRDEPAARSGILWAWGSNFRGQLGDGTTENAETPQRVLEIPEVRAVSAGAEFAHALGADGQLWSWGANDFGQINHEHGDWPTAIQSDGPVQYTQLAAGARTAYALLPNGQAVAWGSNEFNERGNGVSGYHNVPTRDWISAVQQDEPFEQIAAGGSRAVAIDADGRLWTWGNHQNGRLGLGLDHHQREVLVPHVMRGLPRVVDAVLGERTGFALDDSRSVWEWGTVGVGAGPNDRHEDSPVPVPGLDGVQAIAAAGHVAFALRFDGSIWMWGTRAKRVETVDPVSGASTFSAEIVGIPRPVRLQGLPPVRAMAAGSTTLTVLASDGSVWDYVINETFGDEPGSFERGPRMLPDVFGGPVIALNAYGLTAYAIAAPR